MSFELPIAKALGEFFNHLQRRVVELRSFDSGRPIHKREDRFQSNGWENQLRIGDLSPSAQQFPGMLERLPTLFCFGIELIEGKVLRDRGGVERCIEGREARCQNEEHSPLISGISS